MEKHITKVPDEDFQIDEDFEWEPMTWKEAKDDEKFFFEMAHNAIPDSDEEEGWENTMGSSADAAMLSDIVGCCLILERKKNKKEKDIEILNKVKKYYNDNFEDEYPGQLYEIENSTNQYQFSDKEKRYYKKYLKNLIDSDFKDIL